MNVFKTLTLAVSISFISSCAHVDIDRMPASESCALSIAEFIKPAKFSKSDDSIKFWAEFENSVMTKFNYNLLRDDNKGYAYRPNSSHVKILERVFKIKLNEQTSESIASIIKTYEDYMESLVAKGIVKKEEVLLPAIPFKLPDGKINWVRYGEEVPTGGVVENVLEADDYNRMLQTGFFPMGNHLKTTATELSAFEHDLAHLTGFIEAPEFMKRMIILSHLDKSNLTKGQKIRTYFFNESLPKVINKKILLNHLNLSPKMKESPNTITLEEMVTHLQSLSPKELEATRLNLLRKQDEYYLNYGGAGRDPMNYKATAHNFVFTLLAQTTELRRTAETFEVGTNVEALARFQMIMIKLERVTLNEWLYATTHTVPKHSAVYKLFEDERLWNLKKSELAELRAYFLAE